MKVTIYQNRIVGNILQKKLIATFSNQRGLQGAASTIPGPPGEDGTPGDDGLSAYQVALANGFVGTESQWLASLKGAPGDPATNLVISVNSKQGAVVLTTNDIADTTNKRYITDAQRTVLTNTSGVNTGDQDLSGYVLKTQIGAANGVAGLDSNGLVPSSQLPSYVDDVQEYDSFVNFPALGMSSTIYLAIDTGKLYRWSGSFYIEVSPNVAGGNNGNIQYNVGNAFAGSDNFAYDGTTMTLNSPGAAGNAPDSILLTNTTAAIAGVQQAPGAIHFSGNGFATTPGISQSTDWKQYITVTSGSASPSSLIKWDYSVNGGAYNTVLQVSQAGTVTSLGSFVGGSAGSSNVAIGIVNSHNFVTIATNNNNSTIAAAPRYVFGGNTLGTAYRNVFAGANATVIPTNNYNYGNVVVGLAPLTIGASSIPLAANLAVTPIGAFSSTTGSVAKSTTLYVGAPATFGVANYSAYIEGLVNIVTADENFRLSYNDANFTSFTVGTTGNLVITPGGGSVQIPGTNRLLVNDIINTSTLANARLQMATTGLIATRNQAGAGDALTVIQANATSSGNILTLQNSVGTVASVSQTGVINGNALNVTNGFTQTGANYNLFIPSAFNPAAVGTTYAFASSTSQFIRTGFYGNGTAVLTTGANYGAVVFASTPITTFTSGAHNWITNVVIKAPGAVTPGGATVTNTAALFIDGASTDGTNNYGVYSTAGGNVFLGGLQTNTTFTTANFAASGVNVVSTTNTNALFGGATNVSGRVYLNSGTSTTLGAGTSYANLLVGAVPVTRAATGTHNILANVMVGKMGAVGGTGGAITNAVSFYVDGVPTAGTNNYAAWINGITRIDGGIIMPFRAVTSGTTDTIVPGTDWTISWQSAAATKTQNIPAAAATNKGQVLNIADGNGTAAVGTPIVITPTSGTINGASTFSITTARMAYTIQSDGAGNWVII